MFNKIDSNNNSRISEQEFVSHVQTTAFEEIGSDGNAFLNSDEWKNAEKTNEPGKRFSRLDKNRDGRLSP